MMQFQIESVNFWTDSEINLHWLKTNPSLLNTFVSNKVAETQEWSARVTWRHVPTKQYPAGIVPRSNQIFLQQKKWNGLS
ncbi:hypothetical protein CVS40_11845 [Lucilia cuprina]|nr:hypothetical protein CVS40_11845 [Lucilia cuprina]